MKWVRMLSYLVVLVLIVTPLHGVPAADEGDPSAKSADVVTGGAQEAPRVPEDALFEGFEGGVVPPVDWTVLQTNPNETWRLNDWNPHSGVYAASVLYDPALLDQDEILLSPSFSASDGYVDLWSFGSVYWCRDDNDNCDLEVWFVRGAWGGGDDVFLGLADGDWPDTWVWAESTFDFSAYADGSPARIAFRYVGNDGAEVAVDDITINYTPPSCADPHEPNDSLGTATAISYGVTVATADICPAGDLDYYVFSGNAGDPIVADIEAQSLGSALDSYLYLLDSSGTELTYNDDYDGSLDSHIEYTLPAAGTYYLMVREYNHPYEGDPDYYYILSLEGPSFDIDSNWTGSPPSVDGSIGAAEWADAAVYDITIPADMMQLRAGEVELGVAAPEQVSEPDGSRVPVTLYVKNDGTHLYLAFDNPNDTAYNDVDEAGIYFDDNPLPSDGLWTNTTCGNPDGEGSFFVRADGLDTYREIVAGPTFCSTLEPAPGLDGAVGYTSGHVQLEAAIDLTGSALRASPGDSIGMYLFVYDGNDASMDGAWPIGVVWDDPSTYGSLNLASGGGSFDIDSNWTGTAPSVDGSIGTAEWSDAAVYDITNVAGVMQLGDGELKLSSAAPDQASEPDGSRVPVTLYVKNDGTHLYLAFDNPNDTAYADYDEVGIYFDDNPLPSDGLWTNTTCGNPDGEGNFWVEALSGTIYREIVAGPSGCEYVEPAPGVDGTLQFTSGHAQVEVAIDLTSSALRASPGDSIAMYLWIYDANTGVMNGEWPIGALFTDPSTYGSLTLASGGGEAAWTWLVYLDGDNNLEGDAIEDFLEMSSVGSDSNVNIVVQMDRIPGYTTSYEDWTSTKRFLVTAGMTPTPGNALMDIGEANMGDPATLVDFVQWGMSSYPAEHYAVVIWDHGSGWRLGPVDEPPVKDVAYDDTSGGDALDMPELRGAMNTLSSGGADPLDLVGFDACLMAMIEVDAQLIPYASVRVGSEETEPLNGWPYDDILSALVFSPGMTASQLGTVIVDEYYASYGNSQTQSAVDLGAAYGSLVGAVDDFAVALIGGIPTYCTEMAVARGSTQDFAVATYIDLYDLAYRIDQEISDTTISNAATAVMSAVGNAVIQEQHGGSWPGAHGISIYFPSSEGSYNTLYNGSEGWLQFTADTQWDEWLNAFYGCSGACADPHEPNDSMGTATAIGYGETVADADICPAGDEDYYVFEGNAGDAIVADIEAQSLGSALDSYLYLLDSYGTVLTYNDDYGSLDSHIEYTLPAAGTYYLRVREFSHPSEGGPEYYYTLSLEGPSGFDVNSAWTESPPSIDGSIGTAEWADAAVYDITASASMVRIGEGELTSGAAAPDGASEPDGSRAPVTLYVKNDGAHLYLAFDNPNDTAYYDYDQVGIYFDDNPLPSDGLWTNTVCGNPDGEGNFWVMAAPPHPFREIVAGPNYCGSVEPAPGLDGAWGFTSGHAQAEVAIDLTSSALRASPGDSIGMYLWIYDVNTGVMNGEWPIGVVWDDPSTYRSLTLATGTIEPDIEVTPTSFEVTLEPDQTTQRTLTIQNTGEGTLSFELFEQDTTSASPSLTKSLREGAGTPVAPASNPSLEQNVGDSSTTPVLEPSAFKQLRGTIQMLAWVTYTDYDWEYANTLTAIGQYFTDFTLSESTALDSTTLAAELVGKHVLLLPEPEQAGSGDLESAGSTLQPALQDFVNAGGTIVAACDYGSPQGFLPSAGLLDASLAGVWTTASLPVVDPAHPLADGLGASVEAQNATVFYTVADVDAHVVVVDPDSYPVVVARDIGAGHVALIGYDCYEYNDDAARIIANAVQWVDAGTDVPWLSEDPTAGTVPPHDSVEVDVTFDATGLTVGTYTANIVVASNDPDENPVIVPVTLHVSEDNPVIMTIGDGSGSPGSTGNPVTVSADNQTFNTTPIAAGEFWVVYDGSTGLTLGDIETTPRSTDFLVGWSLDDSVPAAVEAHVLLYSLSGATIDPGTDPILELLFDVDSGATPGDSTLLYFSDVALSDLSANPIPVDFTDTGQFTFGCAKDGDINDDGATNVYDLQILVNMILHWIHPDPALYALDWWCRGDLAPPPNGDGQWNVFDLQRLVCTILGTCDGAAGPEAPSGEDNVVSIGDVTAGPGTTGAFEVGFENADPVAAVELWFTYDSTIGLEISNITAASRTAGWTVGYSTDDSDPAAVELHVLVYNASGWSIDPGTGPILTVHYETDEEASGESPLDLALVNLSDASGGPILAKWEDGTFRIGQRIYLPLVLRGYGG